MRELRIRFHQVAFSLSCDNLLLSGDLHHRPSPTAEILHLVKVSPSADQVLKDNDCRMLDWAGKQLDNLS